MSKPYSSKFKEIRNIDKFRCPSCNTNCGMKWYQPRGSIKGSFDTAKSGCDDAIIYLDEETKKYYTKKVYSPKSVFEALYRKKEYQNENEEKIDNVPFFKQYKLPCNRCMKKETCPAMGLSNHFCMNHRLRS